jgi:hypothetical protein
MHVRGNSSYNGNSTGNGNSNMNGPTSITNIMGVPLNWIPGIWDGVMGPVHGNAV